VRAKPSLPEKLFSKKFEKRVDKSGKMIYTYIIKRGKPQKGGTK